jgi:hypothetical protein
MDFVIVGPEKTGTSWIDGALRSCLPHALPNITKETFYLDRLHHLGARWHGSLYSGAAPMRGEVSPSYFARPITRERLTGINPDARIVVMLRDPFARMASHLLHIMRRGEGNPRARDLGLPPARWNEARESSCYEKHGTAWRSAFGAKGVLFLGYDKIGRDPAGLLEAVCRHIGAPVPIDPEWARAFSGTRVFESAAPTAPGLAQLAYKVSRSLQAVGATRLVEAARRSGVRKLFERSGEGVNGARAMLERRLRDEERFDQDIRFAEEALGVGLEEWRTGRTLTPLPSAPTETSTEAANSC